MPETLIAVRVQTPASRDELVGTRDAVLHARVSAPPGDGRANQVRCRPIARRTRDRPLELGVDTKPIAALRGPISVSYTHAGTCPDAYNLPLLAREHRRATR